MFTGIAVISAVAEAIRRAQHGLCGKSYSLRFSQYRKDIPLLLQRLYLLRLCLGEPPRVASSVPQPTDPTARQP